METLLLRVFEALATPQGRAVAQRIMDGAPEVETLAAAMDAQGMTLDDLARALGLYKN